SSSVRYSSRVGLEFVDSWRSEVGGNCDRCEPCEAHCDLGGGAKAHHVGWSGQSLDNSLPNGRQHQGSTRAVGGSVARGVLLVVRDAFVDVLLAPPQHAIDQDG